ncbi:hypothetical protein ACFWBR_42400 [Streptomyces sp. NPDC060006]|uniref:hypothetical protein n=1 Tax=unclassified Streptomyces TaxID=2593676 RepID=UPI00368B379F
MTTPPRGHQAVIAHALDTWWLDSDPAKPLDHTAAAQQVEEHLLHHGYYIAPYALSVPTRRAVATELFLTLACATAAVLAVIVDSWLWGAIGAVGAVYLGHGALTDIRDRRRVRNGR